MEGSGSGLDGVQRRLYQYKETAIEKHYVLQAFTHESHKSIPCYVIHWLLTRRLPVRKHSRCRFTPGNYAPSLMNRMDAEITVILHDCPFPIWYPSLQWSSLPAGLYTHCACASSASCCSTCCCSRVLSASAIPFSCWSLRLSASS